jgi:hypothetical protein
MPGYSERGTLTAIIGSYFQQPTLEQLSPAGDAILCTTATKTFRRMGRDGQL